MSRLRYLGNAFPKIFPNVETARGTLIGVSGLSGLDRMRVTSMAADEAIAYAAEV